MRSFHVQIPANDSTVIHQQGTLLRVYSSNLRFKVRVRFPGGKTIGEFDFDAGQKARFPELFEEVEFINNTDTNINAEVLIGIGDFDDNAISAIVSLQTPSTLQDIDDVSVAAGSAAQVIAANTNRKEVLIGNLADNSDPVRVGSANVGATRGTEIVPGETIVLTTADAIHVYNTGSAAQSVSVAETVA